MVATDATLTTLLDPGRETAERIAAARRLGSGKQPAAIEALTRVAQQIAVPPTLASEVGRTLGYLCFQRARDVHELDMAMFSDEAGDAYDEEIGRLQRLQPDVKMRRAV